MSTCYVFINIFFLFSDLFVVFVTYFHAATDVMLARIVVFVTFPPKAPPILLT